MKADALRRWIGPGVGALALALVALVAQPVAHGWACYRTHAEGEKVEARVVAADYASALVLEVATGPRAGEACTATTSAAHAARLGPGDTLAVVLPTAKPGECVLVATLENSIALLWGLVGLVAAAVLLLVLLGLFLHRTLSTPGVPTTRVDFQDPVCPRCGAVMKAGYVPLLAGLHWREPGEPIGLPTAFSGLPGTVGWRGRPCLHAWRCDACELLTLRYGRPVG